MKFNFKKGILGKCLKDYIPMSKRDSMKDSSKYKL